MYCDQHIQFEWDSAKEKINIAKHRLNFTDACHVFSDVYQLNLFDTDHSDHEERWIVIGEIPVMKIIVVVHTVTQSEGAEEKVLRVISARKATRKERDAYLSRRSQ